MNSFLRGIGRWIAWFSVTLGILFILYVLSASIPKYKIRENLLDSAKYLLSSESLFYQLREGDRRTEIHNYADATTLNILYSIDGKNRVKEILMSSFYSDKANPDRTMTELLVDRITFERRTDTRYDRYWHGMVLVLRPLLLVFDLGQIRLAFLGALLISMVVLTRMLWKKNQKSSAVFLWLGAILVQFPMVAFCIEYFPVFMISFLIAVAMVYGEQHRNRILNLCVVSGVCTAFFDFLTTETLAFVLPMALVYGIWNSENRLSNKKEELNYLFRAGCNWLGAYLAAYLVKWGLASIACGEERFSSALQQFAGRQGNPITNFAIDSLSGSGISSEAMGNAGGDILPQCFSAVVINVRLMLGLSGKITVENLALLLVMVALILVAVLYLFRKPGPVGVLPVLLFLLGAVPVLRMLVLHNHSIEHCFFVYRSFYGTLLCLAMGVANMVDWTFLRRRKKHGSARIKKSG